MLTQRQNSPPVATSKTSPAWCGIINRDNKKAGGGQVHLDVCGYDGKGGVEVRRGKRGRREGSGKQIMTPSHDYLRLPL